QRGVSRSAVYKMLDGGVFPQAPVRLPNGSPRWTQEVVDQWVEAHRCDSGERSGGCRVLAAGEAGPSRSSRASAR
ncbi:MAG: AlpA family phage regulatory protein, partial [Acidobacteria bacterium]|nr:AlpA family phage regulatory protein [Acidobacteriota bacterium]